MVKKRFFKRSIGLLIIISLLCMGMKPAIAIDKTNQSGTLRSLQTKNEKEIIQTEGQYYAVIAACSQYQNNSSDIPKKPFEPISEEKLKQLHTSLLMYPNWKEENIILLLNQNATKENIIAALQTMAQKLTSNDTFLFQWAGHGSEVLDEDGDETDQTDEIICPYDYEKNSTKYLSDDQLNHYFSQIKSKGQIIIIESCLSGGLIDGNNDINEHGRVIILSTFPDTIGRGSFLFGFNLIHSISTILKLNIDKSNLDKNNNNFISIEECFQKAQYLCYGLNSLYWIASGAMIHLRFKYILNPFLSFFEKLTGRQIWINDINDFVFNVIIPLLLLPILFTGLQILTSILTNHYLFNYPHMIDNYQDELNLVQIK